MDGDATHFYLLWVPGRLDNEEYQMAAGLKVAPSIEVSVRSMLTPCTS